MTMPWHAQTAAVWHKALWRTAIVAALFCACVVLGMIGNYAQLRRVDPLTNPDLVALKQDIAESPRDTALKNELRQLDFRLRYLYFQAQDTIREGAYLLLVGMMVMLLALKFAGQLVVKLPQPYESLPDTRTLAAHGRFAVGAFGVLIIGFLLGMVAAARYDTSVNYAMLGMPRKVKLPSAKEWASNWPRFRGPDGNGVVAGDFPRQWNGASGEAIRWKSPVPLPGENSPVVWGDHVFIAGADEHQREVYCFDANTGKLRWRQPVAGISCADDSAPQVMEDTGYAAPTMVVDGTHAAAMFANGDVICFDFDGTQLWALNLGKPDNTYGHATSLVLYRDRLLVQFDQGSSAEDGKSALLALDIATGATVWKVKRDVPNSWATPILIKAGRRDELITCANPWVIAYDPRDGSELWRANCLSGDVAPCPVFADGMVYVCNAYANMAAIRPGGSGDVTKTHVAWMVQDNLPDTVSPLCDGKQLFTVTGTILACYDAKTGKKLWEHEFETAFKSSPMLVGNLVYLLDEEGVMHIFTPARDAYQETGTTALGEKANSSPAYVDGRIYIRGKENIYCIGAK